MRLVALVLVLAVSADQPTLYGPRLYGPSSPRVYSAPATPPAAPLFELNFNEDGNGPSKLNDTLVVNGTTMTVLASYDARDVSGTTWPARGGTVGTLNESSAGTSPTPNGVTPFTESGAEAVEYTQAGKTHTSTGEPSLNGLDFAIEIVWRSRPMSGNRYLLGRRDPSAPNDGWAINTTSTTVQLVTSDEGTANIVTGTTSTVNTGETAHSMFFVDWNNANGLSGCLNGVCTATQSTTGISDIDVAGITLDASGIGDGSQTFSSGHAIIAWRIWTCSGCFAGGATNLTQWTAASFQRSAALWGAQARVGGNTNPNTMTRASSAFVDVFDGTSRRLHLVSSNAPRVARRQELAGGETVNCYLDEVASTNLALQSQTLGTTWTKITGGDTHNSDVAPNAVDGTQTADQLICAVNAADDECGLRQSITLTATAYTWSIYAARNATEPYVVLRDATVANAHAFFNLTDCQPDTVGAGATATHWEVWSADWCRVGITFTGTAAAHNIDVLLARADNDFTMTTPGGAETIALWGAEVEAFPIMTSYQTTTTASVTRSDDVLTYLTTGNVPLLAPYSMMVEALLPNFDTPNTHNPQLFSIGTTGDFASLGVAGNAGDNAQSRVTDDTAPQVTMQAGPDLSNGEIHSMSAALATNNVRLHVDGAQVTSDLSATIPLGFVGDITLHGSIGGIAPSGPVCLTRAKITKRDEVLQ
jgi:hypothetical protein